MPQGQGYAVEMAMRMKTGLEILVLQWIRENPQENRRLEFKQQIDLSNVALKAEFIRDVIALANSEGEFSRSDGHLVIGFRDGTCRDISKDDHDGAKFGEILDSLISPSLPFSYEEFKNGRGGRIGVLVLKPASDVLYIVRKELRDATRIHLRSGQSWGRKSAGKTELDGDTIQSRLGAISNRQIEYATAPLFERIGRLERESGPPLEVKRIRFALEASNNWDEREGILEKLLPYSHEFDHHVKLEVLDAVDVATARTRYGMTIGVFQATDTLLGAIMPHGNGGVSRPSREPFSEDEQELLRRVENAAFEMTWDACRYARDIQMVTIAAQRYWYLIRIMKLNGPEHLLERFLENIRYCQKICKEKREGLPFTDAEGLLEEAVEHALDLSW